MAINVELDYVAGLARTVLTQLGEEAPDWRIAELGYLQIGDVLTDDEPTNIIRARLESSSGSFSLVGAHFALDAPFVDATVEFATQIQDHVLEATCGAPVPPCPGHQHPAVAMSIHGVPTWVCLTEGADRYAAEILPRFNALDTLEEYMERRSGIPRSTAPPPDRELTARQAPLPWLEGPPRLDGLP